MSTEHHDQHSDDPGPGPDRDPGAPPDGEAAHEQPHGTPARAPRLRIAVVAAAVLLAGGGGAYWAAAANGGGHRRSASSRSTVQPLRFDGPYVPAGVAGGGPAASGGGPYRLTGTLPGGPHSAAVETPSGGVGQAQVRQLAQALGLSGPVRSVAGSWQAGGTPDDSGPALTVGKQAPGAWSFSRLGPAGEQPDGTASSTRAVPGYGPDPGTPPVSAQQAEEAAAPVLKELGLSNTALDASRTVGALRTVLADPVVAGLPTHGWTTSFVVGADGRISTGYGRLSALTRGATYPVVSAAAALKELNAAIGAHPDLPGICRVPPTMRPLAPQSATGPTGTEPGLPTTVPCLPRGPQQIEVLGARFGLSMQYVSGVQTLVPSWLFQTRTAGVKGTTVVAQPAVDPSYVVQGPPPAEPASPGAGATTAAPATPVTPVTPVDPGGPVQTGPGQPVDPRAPQPVDPTGYRAQGDTLTLVFWGGVCGTYQGSAQETATQVRVRVTHTPAPPGRMCPMIERSQTVTVTLHQPLGDRTVVDATNGRPVKGQ